METNNIREAEYPNLLSKILLSNIYKYQFTIPPTMSKSREFILRNYEKYLMDIKTDNIKIEKPIFIIGLPRTGSSMLQNLMCSHPDLAFISHLMNTSYPYFCAMDDIRRVLDASVPEATAMSCQPSRS